MRSVWDKELKNKGFRYVEPGGCDCNNYYQRTTMNGTVTVRKQSVIEDPVNCTSNGKTRTTCKVAWVVWRSNKFIASQLENQFKSFREGVLFLQENGITL